MKQIKHNIIYPSDTMIQLLMNYFPILRRMTGLSSSDFAKKMGVTKPSVLNIENRHVVMNKCNFKVIMLTFADILKELKDYDTSHTELTFEQSNDIKFKRQLLSDALSVVFRMQEIGACDLVDQIAKFVIISILYGIYNMYEQGVDSLNNLSKNKKDINDLTIYAMLTSVEHEYHIGPITEDELIQMAMFA